MQHIAKLKLFGFSNFGSIGLCSVPYSQGHFYFGGDGGGRLWKVGMVGGINTRTDVKGYGKGMKCGFSFSLVSQIHMNWYICGIPVYIIVDIPFPTSC